MYTHSGMDAQSGARGLVGNCRVGMIWGLVNAKAKGNMKEVEFFLWLNPEAEGGRKMALKRNFHKAVVPPFCTAQVRVQPVWVCRRVND